MIPLNFHHLYYFHAIAKAGSVTRACEQLFLAQPTLSAQLARFEKAIGHRLFERRDRRLHLTEEGRLVLGYAEGIFGLGRELADALKDRPERGRIAVQVGILGGSPRAYAESCMSALLALKPRPIISAREGPLEALLGELRHHRLDVVLTDTPIRGQDRQEFISHLVERVPVLLAAAPALARRYAGPAGGLDGAPFILVSSPSQVYHELQDVFSQWKIRPSVVAEVQDVELGRRLALAGHGILAVNAFTLRKSLPKGGLVPLVTGRPLRIYESVCLVTGRRRWPNPVADHLMKNFRLK